MGASGNPFQVPLGASAPPADGPARVVKGGGATGGSAQAAGTAASDWKGVPGGHAMRGFSLRTFGGSHRPAGEVDPKLVELRQALHKSEEARRKAAEEAKDEMVQMAKAALAEGMEKGRAEGEKDAWAKYQKQLNLLQKNTEVVVNRLAKEKAEAFLAFEKMAVELFAAALTRILQHAPEWSDEVVLPMLRQAVAALNADTALVVRVHPADFAVSRDKRHFWQTLENSAQDIRFEADERIPRGGCLIEAGATSAAADPMTVAETMVEAVRGVHQARLDALRRETERPDPGQERP